MDKMRVSERSPVAHGPSCGVDSLLVRVTVRSRRVTGDGSQPLPGLMGRRFRGGDTQSGTCPPKQSLDGAPFRGRSTRRTTFYILVTSEAWESLDNPEPE